VGTTDGGANWNVQTSGTAAPLFSLGFADTLRGWAAGDSGLILQTTDGGANWGFDTTRTREGFWAVSVLDTAHCWAVGGMGMVMGYDKAGETGVAGTPRSTLTVPRSSLGKCYPNPFRQITTIKYQISESARVSLRVYNIAGQLVKTLVDEEKLEGNYSVVWDGKDQSGKEVSSGIYFYQLKMGEYSEVKKMLLLK